MDETREHRQAQGAPAASGAPHGATLRLIAALGDAEREDALLPALQPEAGFLIIERCLGAEQLLDAVGRFAGTGRGPGGVDAVLLVYDLHRLTRDRLTELRRMGVPLVALGPSPAPAVGDPPPGDSVGGSTDDRAPDSPVLTLPLDATPAAVCQALVTAARGERYRRRTTYGGGLSPGTPPSRAPAGAHPGSPESTSPAPPAPVSVAGAVISATGRDSAPVEHVRPSAAGAREQAGGQRDEPGMAGPVGAPFAVIAVAGGHGSPGRTTVAVSLAAALGAVAPTVLLDADSSAPSVAAFLDADPTRSLFMLAHAEPSTPREWARVLESEVQPFSRRSPHGAVLCGVPKPEMRGAVSPTFLEHCVAQLRARYRYVVLDTGAEVFGPEAALHRAALGLADRVLFVAAADAVGLWRAKTALSALRVTTPGAVDGLALVVNRHDWRHHHPRGEIEWNLGLSAAAVVPFDHAGAQRAAGAAEPLVFDGRSRAGRALLDLAERTHGGALLLPPEAGADRRRPTWRWRGPRALAPLAALERLVRRRSGLAIPSATAPNDQAPDGMAAGTREGAEEDARGRRAA